MQFDLNLHNRQINSQKFVLDKYCTKTTLHGQKFILFFNFVKYDKMKMMLEKMGDNDV